MLPLSLAVLLVVGPPQQANPTADSQDNGRPAVTQSVLTPPKSDSSNAAPSNAKPMPANPFSGPDADKKLAQMLARNEQHRQAAMRINEMAGNVHSEKDARALVDAIAEELTNHKHLMWAASDVRHRVAHAEYEAVSDPANLIPDRRIADVWNEYVREIDAPEEALITQDEVHGMRWGQWKMSQVVWPQERARSIWNMPNVHAVGADGTLADGGRPLEMLSILNSVNRDFSSILFNRDRQRERAGAETVAVPKESQRKSASIVVSVSRLAAMPPNPIRAAEAKYVEAHGQSDYNHLIRRLFDELFPPE